MDDGGRPRRERRCHGDRNRSRERDWDWDWDWDWDRERAGTRWIWRDAADPEDRRVRVVRRTSAGDDAIHDLAVPLGGPEADWARRVGKSRYREFRAALDEIAGLA